MAKLVLTDVTSGYASTTLVNANNALTEIALENTLSRNGTAPNQMEANLDMNGYRILNQANPITVSGLVWEGPWVTGTTYQVGDIVETSGTSYICITTHTASALFATDIAYWEVVVTAVYPDQVGNNNKFLQTNGTAPSWEVPDAPEISFTQTGTGATAQTLQTKLLEGVSVYDFGAVGTGVANEDAAFTAAFTAHNSVFVPKGTFKLGTKVGEFQSPAKYLYGLGTDSNIVVDNLDEIGFRFAAIGDSVATGGRRVITKIENINFTCKTKASAYATAALDIQSVHPTILQDLRFYGFGPESLRVTSCYYGNFAGLYMVKSGIYLNDVNNIEFRDGDFQGLDVNLPANTTLFGANYPIYLLESDNIKFTDWTFESWDIPPIRLARAKNTIFNNSWFEDITADHAVKMEQAQTLTFNDCYFDLYPHFTGSFIKVDNSIPTADRSTAWSPLIKIIGGFLRMHILRSATYSKPLVSKVNTETPRLVIDGTSFTQGHIYADSGVVLDVKSISLETDLEKSFYSKPNAIIQGKYNSWVPNSTVSDWDFALGAGFTEVAPGVALTFATTTVAGEFMTGTRAAKITGFASDGVAKEFERNLATSGDLTKVTVNGQTYVWFVRLKCDKTVTFEINVNGGLLDYAGTPSHTLPANEWRDYVIKTGEADTWAQGSTFDPYIQFKVTNSSGAAATMYVDRIDYVKVNGDYQI